jgi:hypothetical protein
MLYLFSFVVGWTAEKIVSATVLLMHVCMLAREHVYRGYLVIRAIGK